MHFHIPRNSRWEIKQYNNVSDYTYGRSKGNSTHLGALSGIPLIAVLDRPKKNKDFLPEYCYSKNLEPMEIQKLLKAFDQQKDIFTSLLKELSSTRIIQTHHSSWECSYNTKHSIFNVSKTK